MFYLFLEHDLQEFDRQIIQLHQRIKEILLDGGESAQQTSETWHDNWGFEDCQRQFTLLGKQLEQWRTIRAQAEQISHPTDADTVKIGTRVVYVDEVTGQTQEIRLGSYLCFSVDGKQVSYDSPLGRLLQGHKPQEVVEGEIGGKIRRFRIQSIHL